MNVLSYFGAGVGVSTITKFVAKHRRAGADMRTKAVLEGGATAHRELRHAAENLATSVTMKATKLRTPLSPKRTLVALTLASVLVPQMAMASDESDAEALISRGITLRQALQDRQALPLFQEAVKTKRTPRALAQLGLCELALGLWIEAEDHLKQAMTTPADPWIHKNEQPLSAAYEGVQDKLGLLDVWGEPTGARVTLDGRPAGTLPWERPLRVAAGRRNLVVEAHGFLTDTRTVDVPPRSVAREHVELVRAPGSTSSPVGGLAPAPSAPTEANIAPTASSPQLSQETSGRAEPIYTRWWFWTAIGVAAVTVGGAVFIATRKGQCESSGGGACVAW